MKNSPEKKAASAKQSMDQLVSNAMHKHLETRHCLLVKVDGEEYDEAYGSLKYCLSELCHTLEKSKLRQETVDGFRILENNKEVLSGSFTESVNEKRIGLLNDNKIEEWRASNSRQLSNSKSQRMSL